MRHLKVAIIGNPNCGKSTLFNALTGSKQAVGNWPGVTVERKSGVFVYQGVHVDLVDLPGVYTLTSTGEDSSIDMRIACESLLVDNFDLIVNVIDINNLERNLYLTTQILEMGKPVILVANMQDVAQRHGLSVDIEALSRQLNLPVVGMIATKKGKINELKQLIISENSQKISTFESLLLPEVVSNAIDDLSRQTSRFQAIRSLEASGHADYDIIIADARYTYAHQVTQAVIRNNPKAQKTKTVTEWVDKVVLNRFLGLPIFLLVMYAMFFFSIKIGGAFQPFFNMTSETLFVDGLSQLLTSWHVPESVRAILTTGLGVGISTVITFIPIIFALFLFLAFLEGSGYMARASFVVDRCMRAMGLPGKSFVPLIVGFGCNVPAIMATRTLDQKRDRLLTLMMTPFMSCGARMAIYTVFVAAFFPRDGQNVVFFLYVVGILMAVLTGLLLRKTVLKGISSQWIVELPVYHMPTPLALWQQTWYRLKEFIFNAGRFIVPVCILLGALNSFTWSDSEDSILASAGKAATPVFSPMGITPENWPATLGLLSGVLAKEVVVGTLNTLYTQLQHVESTPTEEEPSILAGLKEAVASIPAAFSELKESFASNPMMVDVDSAKEEAGGAMGVMSVYFDGTVGALAYLLFTLLYFPCISVVAAMIRESNHRWALFSVLWTTALAYGVAVVFYQAVTFARHPASAMAWIFGILAAFAIFLWAMNAYQRRGSSSPEVQSYAA